MAAQVPDAPINVANLPLVTSSTQIGLAWDAGAYNGGISILDYRITYDQGTSTWITLDDTVTLTTFTATSLSANVVYQFKIEARNVVGYSLVSSIISVRAAGVPDKVATPTTAANADTSVTVDWDVPTSDGGSPITSYRIEIRHTDGSSFSQDTADCNGASPGVISGT